MESFVGVQADKPGFGQPRLHVCHTAPEMSAPPPAHVAAWQVFTCWILLIGIDTGRDFPQNSRPFATGISCRFAVIVCIYIRKWRGIEICGFPAFIMLGDFAIF